MATWKHPDLGIFKFDDLWWARTVTLPAFKVFRYRYRGKKVGTSKVPLRFEAEDADTVPSKLAATIAKRVVQNQELLVPKILKALHKDLHGKGPNSGMWWHGDIDSIYEDLSEQKAPLRNLKLDTPDSLTQLLGSPRIVIQESGYGYDKPLATICFEALFEIEHGLGILTNGNRIVGTGYQMDPSPF